MKKIIAFILSLSMAASLLLPVSAAPTFFDVPAGAWYEAAVAYCCEEGLIKGTSDTTFGPEIRMNRGMLVTVLYRMEGEPAVSGRLPFADVPSNAYYRDPVHWAYDNQIVNGTSAATFSPEQDVTREQLVTIFYRYAQSKGLDTSARADLSAYKDSARISGYARDAFRWAVAEGILNGVSEKELGPQGEATRAQCAAILMRLDNHMEEQPPEESKPVESDPVETKPAEPPVENEVITVKPHDIGGQYRWDAQMPLLNTTDSVLQLYQVELIRWKGGVDTMQVDDGFWGEKDLQNISLGDANGGITLRPGETRVWRDGHPMVNWFDSARYTFTFRNEAGKDVAMSFTYIYEFYEEEPPVTEDGVILVEPTDTGSSFDWHFQMNLKNNTNAPIQLYQLDLVRWSGGADGTEVDRWTHPEDNLQNIFLGDENGGITLQPGETYFWDDWHPVVDWFDSARYIFTFRNEAGEDVILTFTYALSHELPEKEYPSFGGDESRDLETLRYDANYCVEVFEEVYWVPARALGDSSYTNGEIQALLTDTPEEKQAEIDTLYEALQLYQIGAFSASDDNIRIWENGINWEHHKPGYDAVRTNTGCCATDSNWLHYILDGDYDEVGYIATSQRDGSGHVYNYIKEDGWYYVIDLTHYRTDWVATAVESGKMEDYWRSDMVLGNIHKVRDIQSYVEYVQDAFFDPPGLMFMYTAENVPGVEGIFHENGITITYAEEIRSTIKVIFDDPTDRLTSGFAPTPVNLPDWSKAESFDFSVIG